MKASDYTTLRFSPHSPTDSCEVHCPECGGWYPLSQWEKGSVECEICDEHDTMICPNESCSGEFNSFLGGPGGSHDPLQVRQAST